MWAQIASKPKEEKATAPAQELSPFDDGTKRVLVVDAGPLIKVRSLLFAAVAFTDDRVTICDGLFAGSQARGDGLQILHHRRGAE